ncbi:glycosyltransferase family 2 protein [Pseudoalteromonas carrageenovora]|uniref:glycosyltransferase family 2 protein n=1 Tax=Pseudoalteromonas carrageenovora TaxID=227 RepID=UPI0026E350DD|nr:glycosyltransferase family 2 protein [Pseudoalteromonas carrageenovora]MDO6548920.1 glycosyltransferase family 2 protein [Pseudoalteromonas carrageenovora]MDO6833425.1 glycosyltransferase family 2 protein [Pseudoalteromonas carrageenovora]
MLQVTVIIPFYSTIPGLLIKAVQSALQQTIKNIQVVVVDDCSPLEAQSELESINDTRLLIIRNKNNLHGGLSRNVGVNKAESQFVAFLDYDDIWYSEKLEKQLSLYKLKSKELSPDVVIYSKCKIIDGTRNMVRPIRAIEQNETVGEYLFQAQDIIQTSGILLPTYLAKKAPFHDLKRHQDYQFCLSLEECGAKFVLLDEIMYEFVQIPKLNDYNFSLKWLDIYKHLLSESAKNGFYYLVVLRSMISHRHYKKALYFSYNKRLLLKFFKAIFIKLAKTAFIKLKIFKQP